MKSRTGYAIVRKGIIEHWPDIEGNEQLDIFTNRICAENAMHTWVRNTNEDFKIVRVQINEID